MSLRLTIDDPLGANDCFIDDFWAPYESRAVVQGQQALRGVSVCGRGDQITCRAYHRHWRKRSIFTISGKNKVADLQLPVRTIGARTSLFSYSISRAYVFRTSMGRDISSSTRALSAASGAG